MAREKRGGGPQRYFPHLKGTHFMRNIDQKNKKLRVLTAALAAAVLALLLPGAVLAQDAAARVLSDFHSEFYVNFYFFC